jgi:uncharacterized membrane protein (DUF2068 family)
MISAPLEPVQEFKVQTYNPSAEPTTWRAWTARCATLSKRQASSIHSEIASALWGILGLWGIAAGAVAYTCVRFTEAWGLWPPPNVGAVVRFAIRLYLPREFVELVDHSNWLHVSLFLGNVAILLYMLFIRTQARRAG